MLRFACPRCRTVLQTDPRTAGTTMACGNCQQMFRVPSAPAAIRVDAAPQQSAMVRTPHPPVAPPPRRPRKQTSGVSIAAILLAAAVIAVSGILFNRFLGGSGQPRKQDDIEARNTPKNGPEPVKTPIPEKVQPPDPPPTEETPEPKIVPGQKVGTLNPSAPISKDRNWFVCFPPNGQQEVPLVFPGNETPDPLPQTEDKMAGYPVTLTFAPRTLVRNVRADLTDDKKSVSIWLSSPEKPANPRHPGEQANTICLLPKNPLELGRTYSVAVFAMVDGKDWSHSWSFTTLTETEQRKQIERPALDRINYYRRLTGLNPVTLDANRGRACMAHARYLAMNVPKNEKLNWNDEEAQLPGYSAEGKRIAAESGIFVGGGPVGLIDWMFSSFFNRHSVLEPNLQSVALGYALYPGRGWVWVICARTERASGPTREPTLFPMDGQKDVPTAFMMRSRPLPIPEDAPDAGYAITMRMPLNQPFTQVSARLTDANDKEIPFWFSSPEKSAVPKFPQYWIGLIPKAPLAEAATYKVAVTGKRGTQPWEKTWSFQTISHDEESKGRDARRLLAKVNKARTETGLPPVVLDADLSHGCDLHARYLVRNFGDPTTQGLGMHDEDAKKPGYSAEGQRAGKASVIASDGSAMDSVDSWLATLYHRVPLLHPSLKRIGVGTARSPDQNWLSIIDCGSDVRGR
jgi:uncharacterized protein YkwD